ncbi:DgyrCDS11673 [Dimorphilus gyrociliatus]|uniref:Hydroxymethylglutaryl-CoA synthase n=1 Tax=Dimorphilus gyrociliatus TaxID=2664684 RepID=A0A7I8W487_9ANNE|nr:DgyrCDS11673 [Dimorphilus gyrociliatus]
MPGDNHLGPAWPENVGILAIEIYFPPHYVDQNELEQFDEVSTGKYVIGLGQSKMGYCTDREDVNSLCLTVVQKLMEKHNIPYGSIGKLEVGTETLLDKSKSVKSVLMQLFQESENTDIEGVDTTNACYGGTAALFNCINWLESSACDGRYAMAVAADIAVYARGSARCTGGAGAVAMLLGPNAPIVFERGVRSTHIQHSYDFYKPNMESEYPIVDGKLTIECYLSALDKCYSKYKQKFSQVYPNSNEFSITDSDAFIFHTPYCKIVQKSLARLAVQDFINHCGNWPELEKFKNIDLEESYFNKDLEKAAMSATRELFEEKTKPSLTLAKNVGNMYTPSVYGGLVSYLLSNDIDKLPGKRLVLFSYGSGLASSMFSVKIDNSVSQQLKNLYKGIADVPARLEKRIKVSPSVFDKIMKLREETCHKAPYFPVGEKDCLLPGTFYLTSVDDMFRRKYARIPPESHNNFNHTSK